MRMDSHTDGRKDGRTDRTKLIVAFRNFAKANKNIFLLLAPGRGLTSAPCILRSCTIHSRATLFMKAEIIRGKTDMTVALIWDVGNGVYRTAVAA
jgi:hypothetical protein